MRFYTSAHQSGNNILVREVDNGVRKSYKVPYSPTLYIKSQKPTKYKSLHSEFLEPVSFGTIKESKEFVSQYDGVDDFEIFGNTMHQYSWIAENFPGDVEFDISKIGIGSIDIEVDSSQGFPDIDKADRPIISIVLKSITDKKRFMFALNPDKQTFGEYDSKSRGLDGHIKYWECDDEEELIKGFVYIWQQLNFDIITGWNIRLFDFPYLINRMKVLFGEDYVKKLSPWKQIQKTTVNWLGVDHQAYDIIGTTILDYMQIYKKNIFEPRESYRLDYIAKVELGEGKVAYSGTIQEFYETDFHKFLDYNIQDVDLIDKLDDKLKLIELVLTVAYDAKVNIVDVLSQVRTWDMKIFNELLKDNIIIPQKTPHKKSEAYAGAYVKAPKPGFYHWVVSFDVASLYPSIIRVLNIGTETKIDCLGKSIANPELMLASDESFMKLVDECKKNNNTIAANGVRYSKTKSSFYSIMIDKLFTARMAYKKKAKECKDKLEHCHIDSEKEKLSNDVAKYDTKQKATKISMNSLYGAIGNEYFRFFDVENAEAVTLTGQFIIQHIEQRVNVYMNKLMKTKDVDYVVYSDTDSVYISLESLVDKVYDDTSDTVKIINFLDKVCKEKLQPFIDEVCLNMVENYLNGMGDMIKMVRDVITNKSIWTSKKRYIMNVYDTEGVRYEKPKLKLMGLEAVKSSTPKPCREKIKEAINIILNKTEEDLITFVSEFREEFNKLQPHEIAFPRGISDISKFKCVGTNFVKGTPIHVKGAIAYNHLVREKNLVIQEIGDGEKIKFVHLIEPNPIRSNTIAFRVELPDKFGLQKYINYDLQFQKSFVEPLKIILDAIKWDIERRPTLESFFV